MRRLPVLPLAIVFLIAALILTTRANADGNYTVDPMEEVTPLSPLTVRIFPGWNLVAGQGETPAQFVAANPKVTMVYGWDRERGVWRRWLAAGPDWLNAYWGLGTLEAGRAYWVWIP